MKKLLSILLISLVVFFGIKAVAVEPEFDLESLFSDTSLQNGVDCFDYYKFQSVQVNVGPNKSAFTAGEEVDFSGKIINENRYPVFNGYVYVRIAEKNPGYIHEGHNIVDEFIALGPLAVDASSSIPVSFSWKIPENLKSGNYTANYFFSVNKKMNLGGLPFTNEIIVGFADFSIVSTKTGNISFLKSSTKVNNEKYNHIGNWPLINPGEKAVVTQVIQNTLKQDLETEISYNLYFWDSLDPKDLISTKKESITLKAGESKTLTYEIPKVEQSVYYLQIVAKNENGTKSIVNIRINSDTAKPRVNYFGLDNFPIQKGATTTLYSCFHNTSNLSASGTTLLIAKDKSGKEISRVSYTGEIPSSISAEKSDFIANTKLDYIKLEQKIYDDKNNLLDSQEIIYDASLIKEMPVKGNNINIVIIYIATGLIIFGFLLFFIKSIRKNKNLCLMLVSVIILLIGFIFFSISYNKITFSSIIRLSLTSSLPISKSTIANFQVSQSGVVSKYFRLGLVAKKTLEGNVDYTYTVKTSATSSSINTGDLVSFSASSSGFYSGIGGPMDTPYLGEKYNYTTRLKSGPYTKNWSTLEAATWIPFVETKPRIGSCFGGTDCVGGAMGDSFVPTETINGFNNHYLNTPEIRYGYRKGPPSIPQLQQIVSSDNSIMSCTNNVCRAINSGIVTLTATMSPSEVILSYNYPHPNRLYSGPLATDNVDSIKFNGFSASWQFKVNGGSVISPELCDDIDNDGDGLIDEGLDCVGGCTENEFDTLPTWGPCDISSGLQTGYFATTTSCVGATNTAPNPITQCCMDKYTYTSWGACDPSNGTISRTASMTYDCPSIDSEPEDLIKTCSGYTNSTVDSLCIPTQGTSNKIYINKQMMWGVVPNGITPVNATTKWSGTNISEVEESGVILNKIYTTVGLKKIYATSTWLSGSTVITASCSTSTNVIFGGGSIIEI